MPAQDAAEGVDGRAEVMGGGGAGRPAEGGARADLRGDVRPAARRAEAGELVVQRLSLIRISEPTRPY